MQSCPLYLPSFFKKGAFHGTTCREHILRNTTPENLIPRYKYVTSDSVKGLEPWLQASGLGVFYCHHPHTLPERVKTSRKNAFSEKYSQIKYAVCFQAWGIIMPPHPRYHHTEPQSCPNFCLGHSYLYMGVYRHQKGKGATLSAVTSISNTLIGTGLGFLKLLYNWQLYYYYYYNYYF